MNFKTTIVLLLLLGVVGAYLKFFALEQDPIPQPTGDARQWLVPEAYVLDATHFSVKTKAKDTFGSFVIGRSQASGKLGGWRLLRPFRFALREKVVEDILIDGLRSLEIVEHLREADASFPGMDAAGLSSSDTVLTFRLIGEEAASETQMQLQFGKSLTAGRIYARLVAGTKTDDDIFIVRGNLTEKLGRIDVETWLRKQLGAPVLSAVKSLSVDRLAEDGAGAMTGTGLKLDRQSAGGWRLMKGWGESEKPQVSSRGSEAAIADYLTKMGQLKAIDFEPVADPKRLATMGLLKPQLRISISATAGTANVIKDAYILNVGHKDISGKAYYVNWLIGAPNSPTLAVDTEAESMGEAITSVFYPQAQVVMRVAAPLIEALMVERDELRERQILSVKARELVSLAIEKKGFANTWSYALKRQDNHWQLTQADEQFDLDTGEVSALLNQIAGLTAVTFDHEAISELPPLAEAGVDETRVAPHMNMTLTTYLGKKHLLRLRPLFDLASSTGRRQWLIRLQADPTNYVIGELQLQRLLKPPLALRDRLALEIGQDQMETIQIKREDGQGFEFEKAASVGRAGVLPWRLKGGAPFEQKPLELLLRSLQNLRVEHWLQSTSIDWKAVSSESALLEFTIKTKRGDLIGHMDSKRGLCELKWEGDIGPIAPASGFNVRTGLCQMPPQLISLLRQEYRKTALLGRGAQSIREIGLTLGTDSILIQKSQRGVFSSPQLKNLDQKSAARVFDMIAGVATVRYLKLSESQQQALLNEDADVQLRVTMTDGKLLVMDVIGAGVDLLPRHPFLEHATGLGSWMLVRADGDLPILKGSEAAKSDQGDKSVWCLLPESYLMSLIGMGK